MLAAFECKLTLTKQHVFNAVKTAARIRRQIPHDTGTPYRELYSPLAYGLLAHSHSWKGSDVSSIVIISDHLNDADNEIVKHPREMLDFLCVSDLVTWIVTKDAVTEADDFEDWTEEDYGPLGSPSTTYFCNSKLSSRQTPEFTPIGIFIAERLVRLAWKDETLRNLASYFAEADFSLSAEGKFRMWSKDIFSSEVRRKLKTKKMPKIETWNEWSQFFG